MSRWRTKHFGIVQGTLALTAYLSMLNPVSANIEVTYTAAPPFSSELSTPLQPHFSHSYLRRSTHRPTESFGSSEPVNEGPASGWGNYFISATSAPAVNLTAQTKRDGFLSLLWEDRDGSSVTHVDTDDVSSLRIKFTCNASYPIRWLSTQGFAANDVDMDEYRAYIDEQGSFSALYTITLALEYKKSSEDSNSFRVPDLRVACVDLSSQNELQSLVSLTHVNGQLNVQVTLDTSADIVQHSPKLGSNEGCTLCLGWNEARKELTCTSTEPGNLTFHTKNENCDDVASCATLFTNRPCCGYSESRRKNSTSILSLKIKQAGIVYCRKLPAEKTSASPYFRSLNKLCPEDDDTTRNQLYVGNTRPSDKVLERDFVSFCAVPPETQKSEGYVSQDQPKFYVGDNITVVCTSSFYHFAIGSRIGLFDRLHGLRYLVKHSGEPTNDDRNRGSFNYTTKVHINSSTITSIDCANYVKQSQDIIWKSIKISVHLPTPVKFKTTGTSRGGAHIYTGDVPFHLECAANGDPMPEIKWRLDGKDIPSQLKPRSSNGFSQLEFPVVGESLTKDEASDLQGTYTCRAENRLNDFKERAFTVVADNSTLSEQGKGDQSNGYIWAIVVPLVLVAAAIIGFLVWKIKRQDQELRLLSKAEVDEFIFGKPEFLLHHTSTEEVNNYAPYLPYNKGYEIDKEQLEIDPSTVLGSGAYAVVLKGVLHQGEEDVKVAIKTAKPMDDVSYFKALLSELKIMGFIGTHPNIVNLVGAYTQSIQSKEIYICIEYCDNGNLLAYLRNSRERYTNQVSPDGEFIDSVPITIDSFIYPGREGLTTITLMKWAEEVATGMEFLNEKKVIHGDLAARNILLTEHLVAKIGDFGLSRQLFEYANYIKKQQSPLPWKWLAIECLQDLRFSVKSDVWAYSIMLFEVFTLGQVPYPGLSYNDEFLEGLVNGKRPNRPMYATKEVYELMSSCWRTKPEDRPTFAYIQEFFGNMIKTLVPLEYIELHEKITSKSPSEKVEISPTATATSPLDQGPSTNRHKNEGSKDRKHFRFSFNAKTVTAKFHRKQHPTPSQ